MADDSAFLTRCGAGRLEGGRSDPDGPFRRFPEEILFEGVFVEVVSHSEEEGPVFCAVRKVETDKPGGEDRLDFRAEGFGHVQGLLYGEKTSCQPVEQGHLPFLGDCQSLPFSQSA